MLFLYCEWPGAICSYLREASSEGFVYASTLADFLGDGLGTPQRSRREAYVPDWESGWNFYMTSNGYSMILLVSRQRIRVTLSGAKIRELCKIVRLS